MEGQQSTSENAELNEDLMNSVGFTAESDDSDFDDFEDEEQEGLVSNVPESAPNDELVPLIDESVPVFEWETGDFVPKINSFDSSKSGADIENFGNKESDFFKMFMTTSLMNFITIETNKQFIYIKNQCSELSWRLKQWIDITVEELYVFLAVCLLMPCNSRNKIQDHWSTDILYYSPIYSDTVSRNRFQIILRMLHFSDNTQQAAGDKIYKIRFLVEHFKKNFTQCMYPYMNVCIDESLLLFKGNLSFRQYIPSKASRFGINFFVICDCATGYVLNFIIYTGKTTEYVPHPHVGISGSVVMTLMEPYLDRGHILYVDNWYTSPILFQKLHDRKTNACGNVRRNRKGMPKHTEKLQKGEMKAFHTDTLSAQIWKDKRDVSMLTTLHPAILTDTGKTTHRNEAIIKPESVQDYNKNMGAVDRSDMILSSVHSSRKTMRWYKKMFFHLMDLSLLNAHTLFCQKTAKRIPLEKFQLEVIRQLIHEYKCVEPTKSVKRKRHSELPSRLTERHFMMKFPPSGKKINTAARCVVCLSKKPRKESRYMCKQCKMALCVEPCSEAYHTVEDY